MSKGRQYSAEVIKEARELCLDWSESGEAPPFPEPPCQCSALREDHGGKAHKGGCERTGCRQYRYEVPYALALAAWDARDIGPVEMIERHHQLKRAKRHAAQGPKPEGYISLSASAVGTCRRALWWEHTGRHTVEDYEAQPVDKRAATMGTAFHDSAEAAGRALFPWREHELELKLPGLDSDNLVDVYDPVLALVKDWKTAGEYRWDHFADGPHRKDWWQPLLYGLALELAGYPVWKLRLVVVHREKGWEEVFEREYDEDEAREALQYLLDTITALEHDDLEALPRDEDGPGLSPICSRFCEHVANCWGTRKASELGLSPQAYAVHGEDPTDALVEQALLGYDKNRAIKSAAEKRMAYFAKLVQGRAFRVYGSMRYGQTTSKVEDDKRFMARIRAFWNARPDLRPADVEALRPPKKERRSISITRVRAATQGRGGASRPPRGRKPKATPAPEATPEQQQVGGAA